MQRKSQGEGPGKYARENMSKDELEDLSSRAEAARACASALLGDLQMSAKDHDAHHAVCGAELLAHVSDPFDEDALLAAMVARASAIGPQNLAALETVLGEADSLQPTIFETAWARNGFPSIRLPGALLANSLMSTGVSRELVAYIEPPWDAFSIAIPSGILSVQHGSDGESEPATRLRVFRRPATKEWTLIVEGGSLQIHIAGLPTDALCDPVTKGMNINTDDDWSLSGRDRRVMRMACSLVVGVVLLFDRAHARFTKKKLPKSRGRSVQQPTVREYILTRPVVVDTSEYVREFIEHGSDARGPQRVQTLVRGHWKNQPHGPKAASRKLIHVEPYWKGPEDAPIGIRPHIIKKTG